MGQKVCSISGYCFSSVTPWGPTLCARGHELMLLTYFRRNVPEPLSRCVGSNNQQPNRLRGFSIEDAQCARED